ncbi:MAG: mechanosensitive ion channel family protein [Oscillospiraceae bacterium]|nr:mechanosensitive ion channel family protein [Oscillospiraceae bacterium]
MNYQIGGISVGRILSALLLLAVCLAVTKLLMRLADRMILRLRVEKSLHRFVHSAVRFGLLFLTVLIVADSVGVPITSLVAVLGVVGLAVSLAVQDSLTKLAGGLMILAAKPFAVGDYIDAGTASGTVREIGLIYTCLSTPDNKVIYLPNNDIASARVTNYSAQENRRVDIDVCASYDDDTETVKKALGQALEAVPGFLKEPAPFIGVTAYLDSSIQYTIRVWAKTVDYWDLYYALLEKIRWAFSANGVEMTYNHLNVHLLKADKKAGIPAQSVDEKE